MKSLFATIKTIYYNDRKVIVWAGLLFLVAGIVVVTTIWNLEPGVADGMIVRYSDAGGYEKGSWWYMLGFALMGVALAVLHPLVAVRLYEKRGGGVAVMFLVVSIMLALMTLLTLLRLVGEG